MRNGRQIRAAPSAWHYEALGEMIEIVAAKFADAIASKIVEALGRAPQAEAAAGPFTLAEAAKKLRVSVDALRGHERAGRVRFARIGSRVLVSQAQISQMLAGESLSDSNVEGKPSGNPVDSSLGNGKAAPKLAL
jgi:hypothetical protein